MSFRERIIQCIISKLFAILKLLVHLYGHMYVIPLITIASICAILLPTYCVYLYRSPGIEFLKILIQHLNQCSIYFFLVTWMQVPVLMLVWLETITFIKLCGFHSLMKCYKYIVHEDTIQRTQRICCR